MQQLGSINNISKTLIIHQSRLIFRFSQVCFRFMVVPLQQPLRDVVIGLRQRKI